MKIAVFSDFFYPELSGVADSIMTTGQALAKRGHQIHYFVPRYPPSSYQTAGEKPEDIKWGNNLSVHRIPSLPIPSGNQQSRALIPHLWRGFFEQETFDCVHTHGHFNSGWEAYWFASIKKIPLIGTNHTFIEAFSPIDHPLFKQWMSRYLCWYFNHCKLVTAPSEFMINHMRKHGLKKPNRVISNPIEPGFFSVSQDKKSLKKKWGIEKFAFIYIGRIDESKNLTKAVKAFAQFHHQHQDAEFILVGHGALKESLQTLAQSLHIKANKIKFLGTFLGNKRSVLFELLHAADVFLMPSVSEVQSMCVLQAMAAGLPILASRFGVFLDLITNDRGILFDPHNESNMADAMLKIYKQEELRFKMSINNTEHAQTMSAEVIANKWEDIYQEIYSK